MPCGHNIAQRAGRYIVTAGTSASKDLYQLGSRDADDTLAQRVEHRRVEGREVDQVQQLVHEPRALLAGVQPRVRLQVPWALSKYCIT
jgi:hypothetical protein